MELKQPESMSFLPNAADGWRDFIQRFEFYRDATGLDKAAQKKQCAVMLHVIGKEAQDVYKTFTFTEEEKDKYDSLSKKFEEAFIPRVNIIYERFKFKCCVQRSEQTMDAFITELKTLAGTCQYGNLKSSLIRGRIVMGVSDVHLQEKLLIKRR